MLEPRFCLDTLLPSLCSWTWYFIVTCVLCFVGWKIIMPREKKL